MCDTIYCVSKLYIIEEFIKHLPRAHIAEAEGPKKAIPTLLSISGSFGFSLA